MSYHKINIQKMAWDYLNLSTSGKFVKKTNHLASCVQGTSNNKKSDVAKFATCLEPI